MANYEPKTLINQSIELSPIILFAFNRPYHTFQTITALTKCKYCSDSTLIVFVDAPRRESERHKVDAVRQIIDNHKTAFKSLEVHISTTNKGCDASIRQGLRKVFSVHDRAIILEDDIVTGNNFIESMNLALEYFKCQEKVFHINAYNFDLPLPESEDEQKSFFMFRAMMCWGWGTWADKWQMFESDPLAQDIHYIKNTFSRKQIRRFNLEDSCDWWSQVEANANGKLDNTWDILWFSYIQKNKGLCPTPFHSMVRNIGHDGSGVHCAKNMAYISAKINNNLVNIFPDATTEDTSQVSKIIKYLKRRSRIQRLRAITNKVKQLSWRIRNLLA